MPISGDLYKQIGRSAAASVCVVAAYDGTGSGIVALTVSSFVTLSFDPPLVMFAIQHNTNSHMAMVETKAFGVSLLSTGQLEAAKRFARKGREKILNTRFDVGLSLRVPLLPDSLAQIECATDQIILSGDHVIITGMVEAARTRSGAPLLYFGQQYGSFTALIDPKSGQ
jgi:flavin reductase (DIM6/NTAB) family NADH-FMN oxidoreductase RutF